MIPTEPDSVASLSCSFFLIKPFFSFFIFVFTSLIRSLTLVSVSIKVITVCLSSVVAYSTSPKQSIVIVSKSSPSSSLITVAPVKTAKY